MLKKLKNDLAILIPAFKSRFFRETLNSIANQTCKNFTLYIGDDCSPDNIEEIIHEYRNVIKIRYVKFPNNIGAKHLVNQWNRCLNLVVDEEWIWLFSDDDIMDKSCVELFYDEINKNKKDKAFRFNVKVINDNNEMISQGIISPKIETSQTLIENLLLLNRSNGIVDAIYSKSLLRKIGGYKYFYFAQGADWATQLEISKHTDIVTIENAFVFWRKGNFNISGKASQLNRLKFKGHINFLIWVTSQNDYFNLNKEYFDKLIYFNLSTVSNIHYNHVSIINTIDLIRLNLKVTTNPFKIINRVVLFYKAQWSKK